MKECYEKKRGRETVMKNKSRKNKEERKKVRNNNANLQTGQKI